MRLTKLELHGFKSFADPTEMEKVSEAGTPVVTVSTLDCVLKTGSEIVAVTRMLAC